MLNQKTIKTNFTLRWQLLLLLSRFLKAIVVRYKNRGTIRESDVEWGRNLLLLNRRLHSLLLLSKSDLRNWARRNRWIHVPLRRRRWRSWHHVKRRLKHRRHKIRRRYGSRWIVQCCDATSISGLMLLLLNLNLLLAIRVVWCTNISTIVTPNHHCLIFIKINRQNSYQHEEI